MRYTSWFCRVQFQDGLAPLAWNPTKYKAPKVLPELPGGESREGGWGGEAPRAPDPPSTPETPKSRFFNFLWLF